MAFVARHQTGASLIVALLVTVALLGAGLFWPVRASDAHYTAIPAPARTSPQTSDTLGRAVLAGGCFWGMEMVFQHVKGVRSVVSGYAGGSRATAHYADTRTGRTGHAESVRIVFDPRKVSYGQLLRIYFSVAHDPTQVDRQGPDRGPQYRSDIFALNRAQQKVASAYIHQLDAANVFARPIATRVDLIRPDQFYPAETYHQNYGLRHPHSLYIRSYDRPRLRSLARHFPALYRETAASEAQTVSVIFSR